MCHRIVCFVISAIVVSASSSMATAQDLPNLERRSISHVAGDVYLFYDNLHTSVFMVTDEGVIATDPITPAAAQWLNNEIEQRFGAAVRAARAGQLDEWADDPRGRLALVILLDQFARNIFRGTADAFAADDRALALTQEAMERGHDTELDPIERVFLYMPLQHAESKVVQEQSVATYEALAESVPAAQRERFEGFTKYARLHRDIVARFGRFPHRNAILGRPSTEAERDYLAGDAPRFGQS